MPSRKRITKSGIVYHVLNRANGRLKIFKKDLDFLATPVPVTTQKIRLYVHRTAYGSPGINEIEVYGE